MKNYILNKTALITGATSGIGKQLALDLSQINVNLVLIARDINKLENLKNEILENTNIKIDIFQLDIRNKNDVEFVMSNIIRKNTIDILINNAGLALGMDHIDKGLISDWEDMIDTNIKGLLYVSRSIIPQMRNLETAHIINIGSVAGKTAYPNGNVYCATKAAVHSIGESMNADLFGTNVKVTTIAPGAVETNFSNVRFKEDSEKVKAVYDGYIPLNSQDISDVIINVLNTPMHVNIQYLDIMPTSQRNPYALYRDI
ncbi:MAG: 3-hydroxy acid dehydrogenase/malonic semialdehyde reductase [Arcobacteraceae bacterium]|jgi:3-hydroxy acid dehydrogenase/malonic semialdehyde reductase